MNSTFKNNLNLIVVGFGCCKQEILASGGPLYDIQRFGINFVNLPEDADVMVIHGFFNEIAVKRAISLYRRIKPPKWVIAVGKCILGQNLWQSSDLFEKFKQELNIDVYIPGCPPRPEAFIYGVIRLVDKL